MSDSQAKAAKPDQTDDTPRLQRALRPDAQPFDEIRVVTVPRFKTSGLAGDEWRISTDFLFYRKGRLVHKENGPRGIELAAAHMGYALSRAMDGAAFYAGEGDRCDQESCTRQADVAYRLKAGFQRDGSPRELMRGGEYRCFCNEHRVRGDCGLEDADRNYEEIPFPPEASSEPGFIAQTFDPLDGVGARAWFAEKRSEAEARGFREFRYTIGDQTPVKGCLLLEGWVFMPEDYGTPRWQLGGKGDRL